MTARRKSSSTSKTRPLPKPRAFSGKGIRGFAVDSLQFDCHPGSRVSGYPGPTVTWLGGSRLSLRSARMTVSSITLKTRMVRPLAIAGFGHYDALPAKETGSGALRLSVRTQDFQSCKRGSTPLGRATLASLSERSELREAAPHSALQLLFGHDYLQSKGGRPGRGRFAAYQRRRSDLVKRNSRPTLNLGVKARSVTQRYTVRAEQPNIRHRSAVSNKSRAASS